MKVNEGRSLSMLIELMFLEATLLRWLRTPDAPICELSPNRAEKRCRRHSAEEIRTMRETMKRNCWQACSRLFYNEGPLVFPPTGWPHPFRLKGLGYWPKQIVGGTAKVTQLRSFTSKTDSLDNRK
jgi:hypothetical protein